MGKNASDTRSDSEEGEKVRKIVSDVIFFLCKVGSMVSVKSTEIGKGRGFKSFDYLDGSWWVV